MAGGGPGTSAESAHLRGPLGQAIYRLVQLIHAKRRCIWWQLARGVLYIALLCPGPAAHVVSLGIQLAGDVAVAHNPPPLCHQCLDLFDA